MINKIYRSVCFLLLFLSNCALAQTDSLQKIKEVVVKANNLVVTTKTAQTIDSTDFLKSSSYNVADALRNFSGVNIKDYGGIGGLKTVFVRSLSPNFTGVQFDGINISDAQTGQIDLGKLMLDNISSISLYQAQPDDLLSTARSFSSASLIVIKTTSPSFDVGRTNKVFFKYTGGSFGLANPVLQYHQKINNNWAFNINSSFQKVKGNYRYSVNGDGSDTLSRRENSEIETAQLDGGIKANIGGNGKLAFRINYYDSERGLPNAVIFYNPTGSQTLWNRDFYSQASYKQKLGDKWNLLLSGKFSNNFTRYNDPAYLNQLGELDNTYTQKEYYQSAATTYQPIKNLIFNYSADVFFTTLHTNLYQYAYPLRTSILQVVGGKYQFKKFIIEGNVLNTYIKEKVKTGKSSPERMLFTPTIALAYELSANITLKGFYKDIFRYPTFNDLYYTNFGNRELNPERSSQYNAGLSYNKLTNNKLNSFSFNLDLYHNQIKDKIIALPNQNLFIWTMYNLDKVAIYGSDFNSKFNYEVNKSSSIQLQANYTFQLALDVSDRTSSVYKNQIPYTPKHTYALNAGYQKSNWGFFYNQIFSTGRYYLVDNSLEYYVKGFLVSDFSVNYQTKIHNKPFTLSAELNNLFNASYEFVRSFPMPGTSLRLTIKTII
jgi:vitamin B12 transporter